MEKTLSLQSAHIKASIATLFHALLIAVILFSPNIISLAHANAVHSPQLAADQSVGTYNDNVTYREVQTSNNGYTETITTYEESYIYQDTITRYIPDTQFPTHDVTAQSDTAIATYGSFRVISANHAEMVGTTDSHSMERFSKMIAAYPLIKKIDMIDVAGTIDDEVNLQLARKINNLGIATHIPANGSVRSGGVELFLAGAKRSAHPNAHFAVHSWQDEDGYEPHDYPKNDPIHRDYIQYYQDIARMSKEQAKAFYWMTNSANHDEFIELTTSDIANYTTLS